MGLRYHEIVDDNISKIKEKVDIVDLVNSYVKLTKAGMNWKARCPFHNEKSGSFFVSPERQIWHCFGCGLGGDIFGFVKQIEGVEFPEALRILAARAGIELTKFRPNPEFQNAKTRLYEISELASKFFGKQLHESVVGKQALAYLKNRGLNDQSISTFKLGYAPDSWSGLTNFLYGRGYSEKEIIDAGLAIKGERGAYDRFRSRIMFPIFDLNSQAVGFAGRIFESEKRKAKSEKQEEPAKYVNTPQTAIYDKGKLLYGLNFARMDLRRKNRCLVVEGNMDVIMSHQAGATNAVASSGTALTDGHLHILKRYTENLDLCFDADSAGSMATERGVDLALSRGFNINIVPLDEKDPADYVKAHGNADFVNNARPFMEFFFESFRKGLDLNAALGKKMFSQKLLPFVAAMANKIEQAHWVAQIATALKVKEDVVRAELVAVTPRGAQNAQRVTSEDSDATRYTLHEQEPKLDIFEESLLSLTLKKPSLAESLSETERAFLPQPTPLQAQFIALKAEEYWKDFNDAALETEFKNLLHHLKKRRILATLERLEYEIKEAEQQKDQKRLATLVAEFTSSAGQL